MAERERLLEVIRDLLHTQPLAVLATRSQGQPYANLMAFAATADIRQVVFATRRDTHTFANLLADPRVALLVDSRANRPEDFTEAAAVTILGRARELIRTWSCIRRSTPTWQSLCPSPAAPSFW